VRWLFLYWGPEKKEMSYRENSVIATTKTKRKPFLMNP